MNLLYLVAHKVAVLWSVLRCLDCPLFLLSVSINGFRIADLACLGGNMFGRIVQVYVINVNDVSLLPTLFEPSTIVPL